MVDNSRIEFVTKNLPPRSNHFGETKQKPKLDIFTPGHHNEGVKTAHLINVESNKKFIKFDFGLKRTEIFLKSEDFTKIHLKVAFFPLQLSNHCQRHRSILIRNF